MRLVKQIITLLAYGLFFLQSGAASAFYFAYIPDIANQGESKYLHVVNTDANVLVTSIVIFGAPREVVLSHSGEYVYVSAEIIDGNESISKLNVISTATNELIIPISLQTSSAWGMAISQDDSTVYVTHRGGITRILEPVSRIIQTTLNITYSGVAAVLSDDDKYLFVIGPDNSGVNFGISVIDVSTDTMAVVTDFPLGSDVGSFDIVFDNMDNLFVLNRSTAELIQINIFNYDLPESFALLERDRFTLPDESFPTDMALNKEHTEIFISLSYVNENNVGTGDGYIMVLKTLDLSIVDKIFLSLEGSVFALDGGALHPRGLGFDDSGKLHVIKQLWSEFAGTYISSVSDVTNIRSGIRKFNEGAAITMGKRSSNLTNGKFIGPDCSYCPSGIEDVENKRISASAINPVMVMFVLLFLVLTRVNTLSAISYSRSRWRYKSRF